MRRANLRTFQRRLRGMFGRFLFSRGWGRRSHWSGRRFRGRLRLGRRGLGRFDRG